MLKDGSVVYQKKMMEFKHVFMMVCLYQYVSSFHPYFENTYASRTQMFSNDDATTIVSRLPSPKEEEMNPENSNNS